MNDRTIIKFILETSTGLQISYVLYIQNITTYTHLVYHVLRLTGKLGIDTSDTILAPIYLRMHLVDHVERLELNDRVYNKALARMLNGDNNIDIYIKVYDEYQDKSSDKGLINSSIECFINMYNDLEYIEDRVQENLVNSIAIYKHTSELVERYEQLSESVFKSLVDTTIPNVYVDRIVIIFNFRRSCSVMG
jgi:hypothetical protein